MWNGSWVARAGSFVVGVVVVGLGAMMEGRRIWSFWNRLRFATSRREKGVG